MDSVTICHIESTFSYSDPAVGAVIAAAWLVEVVGPDYLTFLRRDA